MANSQLPKWSTISREERFFTSVLFHDLMQHPQPFWEHLKRDLPTPVDSDVVDVGYELCFFRDAFRANLIERHRDLEKQTFDLVLTLTDQALVLIEAKAHQGYGRKQLALLHEARDRIITSPLCPIQQVYVAGLYSSKYKLRSTTVGTFGTTTSWAEVAQLYPNNADTYLRADAIYGD